MLWERYLCLMRVLYSKGNMADAEEIIQKIENAIRESSANAKYRSRVEAMQARIWLTQNKLEAVSQWVRERGLDVDGVLPYACLWQQ